MFIPPILTWSVTATCGSDIERRKVRLARERHLLVTKMNLVLIVCVPESQKGGKHFRSAMEYVCGDVALLAIDGSARAMEMNEKRVRISICVYWG